MNKLLVKYVIDMTLIACIIISFTTGVIKFPGLFGNLRRVLPMFQISRLHDWTGLLMGSLIIVHLLLNYKWIINMTKKYFGREK